MQNGRATVDMAEYTQQMLKIARDQLEVSKQALRQGGALDQGYAALNTTGEGAAAENLVPDGEAAKSGGGYASKSEKAPVRASDEKPALVVPDHKPGDLIEYRTKLIRVDEAGYDFAGRIHESFETAAAYVDQDTALPPKTPDEPKLVTDRHATDSRAQQGDAQLAPPRTSGPDSAV
ncbi:hypothetical protein DDZ14_02750 [Maritimibacter sp. 55A14]|nr:hypothetical protein DDZ14_02750 [Maritimibacter sp. 55A14]